MTITAKLPPELEQALRQRCAAAGRRISETIRDARGRPLDNLLRH